LSFLFFLFQFDFSFLSPIFLFSNFFIIFYLTFILILIFYFAPSLFFFSLFLSF